MTMQSIRYYTAYRNEAGRVVVQSLESAYHAESVAKQGFPIFKREVLSGCEGFAEINSVREEFERQES